MALEQRIEDRLASSDITLEDPVTALTGVTEESADRYAAFGAEERTVRDLFASPIGLGAEIPPQYSRDAVVDLLSVDVTPGEVGVNSEADLGLLRFATAFNPRWYEEEFDEYPHRDPETIRKVPYRARGGRGIWVAGHEDDVLGPAAVLTADLHSTGYLSHPVDINGTQFCLLTTATDGEAVTDDTVPVARTRAYNIMVASLLLKTNLASSSSYRDAVQFTTDPVTANKTPYSVLLDVGGDLRMALRHESGQNSVLRERVLEQQ